MDFSAVDRFLQALQERIVSTLSALDGRTFRRDPWERAEGGGGITCVLEGGALFERAGVGYSCIVGTALPPSASLARPELAGRAFRAAGVSVVVHPRNPYVPTVHMNVRFFAAEAPGAAAVWWFGGGMDLTPYYAWEDDARHFHRTCRDALAPFGADRYARYKRWCDDYFFVRHRNESRGIGGIFFDDQNQPDFDTCFEMTKSVGEHFRAAYVPIVERRRTEPYGERERAFQAYRRGRYVEFNLVYDRGTLFGLQSAGRVESILMSMPPEVSWRYDWHPDPGSREAQLTRDFLVPRDWIGASD